MDRCWSHRRLAERTSNEGGGFGLLGDIIIGVIGGVIGGYLAGLLRSRMP